MAIYERFKEGRVPHYEVIIIQSHDGFSVAGKEVEASEFYPRSEDWGTYGWTYSTLEEVKVKTATLSRLNNQNSPQRVAER